MKNKRPDIEHWWAVEAMIASYNHVYQVVYNTRHEEHGAIAVSIYNDAPIASFHYEIHALSPSLEDVADALEAYSIPEGKQHIVNIFHEGPAEPETKNYFNRLGLEFTRTGPILGYDLPLKISTIPLNIHKAKTLHQTEVANNSLAEEGERIH